MVILEGPDCVGKTTVANKLRHLLPGWSVRHHGVPPPGWHAYDVHMSTLADSHPRLICDRLHFSEVAYGAVYRNKVDYNLHEWRLVELAALTLNSSVIFLNDEPEAIRSRWEASQDFSITGIPRLVKMYREMPVTPYHTILPYRGHTLRDLITEDGEATPLLMTIVGGLKSDAVDAIANEMPASAGYGHRQPIFMAIGEAISNRRRPGAIAPQLPWDFGSSSEWFWRLIDKLPLPWGQGYYTNAGGFRSAFGLVKMLAHLQPDFILSLGSVAHALLDEATRQWSSMPPVVKITHPQYVRRFQHGQFDDWKAQALDGIGKIKSQRLIKFWADTRPEVAT